MTQLIDNDKPIYSQQAALDGFFVFMQCQIPVFARRQGKVPIITYAESGGL